ncbi:MAG: hypothetical protein AAB368_03505 [bacterium]
MGQGLSNWTKFKWPYAPLDTFTRSEPFPSSELKDTYVGGTKKPRRRDAKVGFNALRKRWNKVR